MLEISLNWMVALYPIKWIKILTLFTSSLVRSVTGISDGFFSWPKIFYELVPFLSRPMVSDGVIHHNKPVTKW